MKDLQHDNAKHCLDFHRVNAAAILCYLLLDVTHPPPCLLVRDPRGYLALVKSAGGITCIQYLFHAAIPLLTFQYATRAAAGKVLTDLLAFSFHCFRCFGHKTGSVFISLTALTTLFSVHDKVKRALENYCCISLLGRIFIAFDRFLEYINMLQLNRGTAFKSFDTQLQFSHYLKCLVHVDAAWKQATTGDHPVDSGTPSYLYNDIAEMRRQLRQALGTDLTQHVYGNAVWHTGNAVPRDGGDYRARKPEVWWREVAAGRSRGRGRASVLSWRRFVRAFLDDHWF